jgi:eukaryotic-like serine/threonine-protein kinase
MMERARPRLSPGENINGLLVEELVGVGGFGSVYRARRPGGGLYALKFMPLGPLVGRALREFGILMRLRHRNLVQVVAMGLWPEEAPEYLWLQFGFVEGERLDRWAKRCNPPARKVGRRVLEVARGLAVAHAEGVVHRDVKEANIIVRERDGEAVLVDFGSGTHEEARTLTQGILPPGTLGYVSPEALRFARQHQQDEVEEGAARERYRGGPGDDLYALGVVLYRLLTGNLPFAPVTEEEAAVISRPPVAPHVANPRVPRALGEVCLRLLAKEPQARYASAEELCGVLEELLEEGEGEWDEPLLEEPTVREEAPGPAPRQLAEGEGKRAGRGRKGRVAVGLALAACLGGAAWVTALGQAPVLATSAPSGEKLTPAPLLEEEDAAPAPPGTHELATPASAPPAVEPPTTAVASLATPPKEDTMKKQPENDSKRTETRKGSGARVAACTSALFLAGACVGGPSLTRPPEDMDCPAGSIEAMEKVFNITPGVGWGMGGVLGRDAKLRENVAVSDGDNVFFTTLEPLGNLPSRSTLTGRVTLGAYKSEPAAYFRFTHATSADGRTKSPVCLCAVARLESDGKVVYDPPVFPVKRYYAGCDGRLY